MLVTNPAPAREVVNVLKTRKAFESNISALADADFSSGQVSVFSSHESIAAASSEGNPWRNVLTALVVEIEYKGPLVASGLIVPTGGQMAIAIAGMIGAAVCGVAFKKLMDEVAAKPHTGAFARTVEASSIILWVRVEGETTENTVPDILVAEAADNVHASRRKAETWCGNSNQSLNVTLGYRRP